jgi:hypothetical protein
LLLQLVLYLHARLRQPPEELACHLEGFLQLNFHQVGHLQGSLYHLVMEKQKSSWPGAKNSEIFADSS